MSGASAASVLYPGPSQFGAGWPDLPVAVRWREAASLHETIRQALLEPDFTDSNNIAVWSADLHAPLFLAAKSLLGREPAYAIAVVDHDGRLRFKETLKFSFGASTGVRPGEARPDAGSTRRLKRLTELLADRLVFVPDELSSDLDGLREPLCHALCVQSLSPLLARRARPGGAAASRELLAWVSADFDGVADPGGRARFLLRAWDWTPGVRR